MNSVSDISLQRKTTTAPPPSCLLVTDCLNGLSLVETLKSQDNCCLLGPKLCEISHWAALVSSFHPHCPILYCFSFKRSLSNWQVMYLLGPRAPAQVILKGKCHQWNDRASPDCQKRSGHRSSMFSEMCEKETYWELTRIGEMKKWTEANPGLRKGRRTKDHMTSACERGSDDGKFTILHHLPHNPCQNMFTQSIKPH